MRARRGIVLRQKKTAPVRGRESQKRSSSDNANIDSTHISAVLVVLLYVVRHLVALSKRVEAGALNSGEMDEYAPSGVDLTDIYIIRPSCFKYLVMKRIGHKPVPSVGFGDSARRDNQEPAPLPLCSHV